MLEIIFLFAIAKQMEMLAVRKGEKPMKWKLITICAWIGTEFTVGFIGGLFSASILVIYVPALALAVCSYLVVKYKLNRMPDKVDLLETIGQEPKL